MSDYLKPLDQVSLALGLIAIKGQPFRKDLKGTVYTTLTASGPKQEGFPFATWFASQEEAVSAYLKELSFWLAGKRFIVWRSSPEINYETQGYNIFSRLTSYKSKEEYDSLPDLGHINSKSLHP